jgi:hypothetical protein
MYAKPICWNHDITLRINNPIGEGIVAMETGIICGSLDKAWLRGSYRSSGPKGISFGHIYTTRIAGLKS